MSLVRGGSGQISSPPLVSQSGKVPDAASSPSATAERLLDASKLSAKATPVRMPPRPSSGRSPNVSALHATPGRQQPVLSQLRDSAELRRKGRASRGDVPSVPDLTLTGKAMPPGHPLLGGSILGEDGAGSAQWENLSHTCEMVDSTPSHADGSDNEDSIKPGEEEARILQASWQGSESSPARSAPQSPTGGRDTTMSPPPSAAWSPEARRITGASVDRVNSRAYDESRDDDSVNQSVNASAEFENARLATAQSFVTNGNESCSPAKARLLPPSMLSPGEAPAAVFRGTIAARALLGRKRVYGAVLIQRWFRLLLNRQAQRQQEDVKSLLRERRQKKADEEQARRVQEDLRAASLRAEQEQSVKAALEQREEDVKRATERLKRNLDQSLRLPAPVASSTAVISAESADTPIANDDAAGAGGDEQELPIMDALRASVERSADALGFARANGSPCAECSPPAEASALYGLEDADASSETEACIISPRDFAPSNHTQESPAPSPKRAGAAPAGTSASTASAGLSPGAIDAASACQMSMVVGSPQSSLQGRVMHSPGALSVGSSRTLQVSSHTVEENNLRTEQQGNLEKAAKELQTSILSFLDNAEAETASVNASFSTEAAGFAVPPPASSFSAPHRVPHGEPALASRPPLPASLPISPTARSRDASAWPSPAVSGSGNGTPVLAAQVFGDVKARMAALKVELEQKDKAIFDLKDALRRQKEEAAAKQQQHADHVSSQLSLQRLEYEAQVKRQLDLVDQLVADKGALSVKCEELAAEFQLLQRKFQDQVKDLEDKHAKELRKQRESMAISEKIRRDTWMQDKSREIKEMTVKGLQPEIERLLSKHKKELQRMEEVNVHELQRQRNALAEAHERSMNESRERMLVERDRAVEREREAASQRLREQAERFDQQLQAQRVRLTDDMAQERERLETTFRVERQRVEDMYGMQIKDDSRKLADVQREWADKEEELRRRHASEIARVREQSEIERDQWQKAMNEKLEQQQADALAALTDKMEKQRDEEIDLVIVRLEEEAEVTKAKFKKEADEKAQRAIEQSQEQVHDAKSAEKEVMDKYLALFKQHTTADERLVDCSLCNSIPSARACVAPMHTGVGARRAVVGAHQRTH